MTFSRSARGLLAAIASASLLLCQTAMAAQACAPAPEAAASGHCHGVADQPGDDPGHVVEQNCPAGYVSASLAKLDIPQAADSLALEIEPAWLRAPVRGSLSADAPPARAEPPPLILVHCCLRN